MDVVPSHQSGEGFGTRTVLNLNDVESVGLLLLVLYSAGLSAMELLLNESQALGMSLAVFVWLGVLLVLILARLWARKMARKTKVTVKRMSRGASARSTGTLDGGVLPSSSRSQRMQLKVGGEATEVEMASQLGGSRDGGGGDEEEAVE